MASGDLPSVNGGHRLHQDEPNLQRGNSEDPSSTCPTAPARPKCSDRQGPGAPSLSVDSGICSLEPHQPLDSSDICRSTSIESRSCDDRMESSGFSEEDLLDITFEACDTTGRGEVLASAVVQYLQAMTGQSSGQEKLGTLHRMLDPDGQDPPVTRATFHSTMRRWIAQCSQGGISEDTYQASASHSCEASVTGVEYSSPMDDVPCTERHGCHCECGELLGLVSELKHVQARLRGQNSSLVRSLSQCDDTNLQLALEVSELHTKLASAQLAVVRVRSVTAELDEARCALKDSQEKHARAQAKGCTLVKENECLKDHIKRLEEKTQKLEVERNCAEDHVRKLNMVNAELKRQFEEASELLALRDRELSKKNIIMDKLKDSYLVNHKIVEKLQLEVWRLQEHSHQTLLSFDKCTAGHPMRGGGSVPNHCSLHQELQEAQQGDVGEGSVLACDTLLPLSHTRDIQHFMHKLKANNLTQLLNTHTSERDYVGGGTTETERTHSHNQQQQANSKQQLLTILRELDLLRPWREEQAERQLVEARRALQEARGAAAATWWKAQSMEAERSRSIRESHQEEVQSLQEQVQHLEASLKAAQQEVMERRRREERQEVSTHTHTGVQTAGESQQREAEQPMGGGAGEVQSVATENLLKSLWRMEAMVVKALQAAQLLSDGERKVREVQERMEAVSQRVERALSRTRDTQRQLSTLEATASTSTQLPQDTATPVKRPASAEDTAGPAERGQPVTSDPECAAHGGPFLCTFTETAAGKGCEDPEPSHVRPPDSSCGPGAVSISNTDPALLGSSPALPVNRPGPSVPADTGGESASPVGPSPQTSAGSAREEDPAHHTPASAPESEVLGGSSSSEEKSGRSQLWSSDTGRSQISVSEASGQSLFSELVAEGTPEPEDSVSSQVSSLPNTGICQPASDDSRWRQRETDHSGRCQSGREYGGRSQTDSEHSGRSQGETDYGGRSQADLTGCSNQVEAEECGRSSAPKSDSGRDQTASSGSGQASTSGATEDSERVKTAESSSATDLKAERPSGGSFAHVAPAGPAPEPFFFPHTRLRAPAAPAMPTLPEEEEDSPEEVDSSSSSPITNAPSDGKVVKVGVALPPPTIILPMQEPSGQQGPPPKEHTRSHSPRPRLARSSISAAAITTVDKEGHVIDLVKDQLPELPLSEEDRQKNLELLEEAKKVSDRFLSRRGRRSTCGLSDSPPVLTPNPTPSSSPNPSRSSSVTMPPAFVMEATEVSFPSATSSQPPVRVQGDRSKPDHEILCRLVDWKPSEKRKVSSGTLVPRHVSPVPVREPQVLRDTSEPQGATDWAKRPAGPSSSAPKPEEAPGRAPSLSPATGVAKPVPRPPTQQAPCTAEIKTIGAFPPLMRAVSWDTVGSIGMRNGSQDFSSKDEDTFSLSDKPSPFKSTGYKDFPVPPPANTQKLSKLREEHKLIRNQSISGSKLPDLSEMAEQDRGLTPSPIPVSPADDEAKEKADAMPNISDVMLRKLRLHRGLPGCAPPLSEKEVENAFVQLSLAFRNDQYTLETRLRQAERERNLTEENTEKELEEFKGSLKGTVSLWQNIEQRECYQRLIETVAVLHRLATRLSSRAEMVGAVRQEKRMNKATEVMMQYVENLKRTYEKDHAELMEFKKLANQNSNRCYSGSMDTGEDGVPRASRSMSLTLGKALPRRRVSVAVVPKFNLLNIPGQTPATAPAGPVLGPGVAPGAVPVPVPAVGAALPVLCEPNGAKSSSPADAPLQALTENGTTPGEQEGEAPALARTACNPQEVSPEVKAKIEEEAYNKGYQEGLKRCKELQELKERKEEEEKVEENKEELKENMEDTSKEEKKTYRWSTEALEVLDRICPNIFKQNRLLLMALTLFLVLFVLVNVLSFFSTSYSAHGGAPADKSTLPGKKTFLGLNVGPQAPVPD